MIGPRRSSHSSPTVPLDRIRKSADVDRIAALERELQYWKLVAGGWIKRAVNAEHKVGILEETLWQKR